MFCMESVERGDFSLCGREYLFDLVRDVDPLGRQLCVYGYVSRVMADEVLLLVAVIEAVIVVCNNAGAAKARGAGTGVTV